MSALIEMTFGANLGWPKEPCVRWLSRAPEGQFLGLSDTFNSIGSPESLFIAPSSHPRAHFNDLCVFPRKRVHFGWRWRRIPYWGCNLKTFWRFWIAIFVHFQTCIKKYSKHCTESNRILHSHKNHQLGLLFVGSLNAWYVSKMADGRHFEKSEKSPYFQQRCVR